MDILLWYLKACFSCILWKVLNSQTFFDTDSVECEIHSQINRVSALETTLAEREKVLWEMETHLEEVKNGNEDAYKDLLRMYGSRILPTDSTIDAICKRHPQLVIGSRTECHRYYNCSGVDEYLSKWVGRTIYAWPSKYLHECHYPFLFSEETLQCENYTDVDCGTRYKPIWECNYFRLHCKASMCYICEMTYPRCEYEKDGFWHHDARGPMWNYYKVCQDGRTIASGMCPYNDVWSISSFPYNGECVHLFAIPKDDNSHGYLPSCKGTPDGNYKFPVGPCAAYYRCEGGNATAVRCPTGTVFDKVNRTCEVGGTCT